MNAKIFISSTIHDFRDLRSSLKFHFENFGYTVQLSEYNDFKKPLDVNSYQACLESIKESDYFILLIGSRVGGYYDIPNAISITQKEYQVAYERSKDHKLKLLIFVRDEIWSTKEDRKALEKCLKEDTELSQELEPDELDKIVNHSSRIINDAAFIFDFIDEVCRKSEMLNAIKGSAAFPRNNWVHTFKHFKDIIDVINNEFNLNTPVEELALRHNLKTELLSNIRALLAKFKDGVGKSNSWAAECRQLISKSMDVPSEIPYEYFKWLIIYAAIGPSKRNALSTYFIEKAIGSGLYLQFNNSTNSYDDSEFSKYLKILNGRIASYKSLETFASENTIKFIKKLRLSKKCT